MKTEDLLAPPKLIRQNCLLHVPGKAIDFDNFLLLRRAVELGKESAKEQLGGEHNLSYISENLIRRIEAIYGGEGLFQLTALAMMHDNKDLMHFIEATEYIISVDEMALEKQSEPLLCDDSALTQSPKLNRFNSNVLCPSLSRKLYRAGRHQGALVYGVGGARILVSHPFRDRSEHYYDVYSNSFDVVTSLCLRGYRGAFHFLDYLDGLDHKVEGMPAWALWFSIIAANSDLVIFVKEYEGELRWTQQIEIDMTPDRVQKIIVSIPHEELSWAKKTDRYNGLESIYAGEHGFVGEQEWMQMEKGHAEPFIQTFIKGDAPRDRLVILEEMGSITSYPIHYPIYRINEGR